MSEREDKERILIVDDDDDTRKSLSLILGRKGYETDTAGTGDEALEKAKGRPCDLVLLDIRLPDADGIELIASLKEPNPDTEIVVTTGYASVENAVQALNQGASAYLTKPLNMDEVLATIGNILEKQRLVREKRRAEERIEHLNAVLRAIRNVNQLIIREGDRPRLLKGICDNLTETRGYFSCWAALIDDSRALVNCTESGLGEDFKPVVRRLKEGRLPQCAGQALEKPDIVLVEDVQQDCKDCPLAQKYEGRGAMVLRMEHGGRVYGLLAVSVPAHVTVDEEELSLFREVTGDIAFALHGIEQEEQRERAEEELRRSEENYRTVFESTIDGMVVIDAETMRVVLANEAAIRMYGFDPGEDVSRIDPLEHIHPEDRERAVTTLAEDMFVKNLGETVKFRTLTKDGGVKWVSGRGTVIDYQGRKAGLVSFRDVTAQKQAEDALRQSEEKFKAISLNSPDHVLIHDLELKYTFILNPQLGLTVEEMLGKTDYELGLPKADADNLTQMKKGVLEGNSTEQTLIPLSNLKGEIEYFEGSYSPKYDRDGKVNGLIGYFRNVTARKRAEERIEHLNAVLRAIRNVNQLIIRETDRTRLLQDICNTIIETRDYFSCWAALLDDSGALVTCAESGLGEDFKPVAGRLKEGRLTRCAERALEKPDIVLVEDVQDVCGGCPLAAKYEGRGAMVLRMEHEGRVYGLLAVSVPAHVTVDEEELSLFREVTGDIAFALHGIEQEEQRERAEEELRESEKYFREITENSSDIIIITDRDGTIFYCSPSIERSAGYKPKEIIGRSGFEFIHPDDVQRAIVDFGQSILTKDIAIPNAFRILHKDGSVRYFAGLGKNLLDHPSVAGFIMNIRDDTERRLAEEALRHSEENYRAVFEGTMDGLIVIDAETLKIVLANDAVLQLYGFDPDADLSRINPLDYVHPDDRERALRTILEDMFQEDLRQINEFRVYTNQGEEKWVSTLGSVIDYQGRKAGLVSFRDITAQKQAEEALRLSEGKLRAMFDTMNDGIVVIDTEGRVIDLNEAAFRIAGFSSKEELLGANALDFIADKDREHITNEMAKSVADGTAVGNLVCRVHRKDGSAFDLELSASILKDSSGTPVGFIAVERDVTERNRAEEALRASEDKYEMLISNIPHVTWISDKAGGTDFISQNVEKVYGYTPEEIGKSGGKLWFNRIHTDDIKAVKEAWDNLFKSNTKYDIEYRIQRKDGRWIWLHDKAVDTLDRDGIMYAYGVFSDVTERKQTEEEIRASEEKYRDLVENMNDALYAIDKDGTFTYISPIVESVVGYTPAEIIGRNFAEHIHPDDLKSTVDSSRKVLAGESTIGEYRVISKSGEARWVRASNRPIYRGEQVVGVRGILTDITERKLAEEEVKRYAQREATLLQIAQAVSQTTDMDKILNSALTKTCEAVGIPAGGIYLLDWVEWRLILRAHYGVSEEYVNAVMEWKLGEDEIQRGFKLKESFVEADKMFSKGNADKMALAMKKEGLKSSVNIIFRSKGLPVGGMVLADRRKRRFSEDELELLQAVADQIAIGIENVQLLELSREMAVTDEMTGLYNRRHFYDVLESEMARTIRYEHPFTLVLLDLDGFKEYNDKYGHVNGDAVLKSLAQTLKSTLRKSDTSFRYGGDEFAVILAGTDAERSKKVIERIRKRWLHTPKAMYPILETPIGFSAGIAQFPEHADTADGLVFMADNALYHAKSKGGYRTVLASDMESISPEILEVATPDHVLALASTVDAKDPYTYGHSKNVADIAQALGKAIGMSGKELTDLRTASLLHDIGKLGVPDAILTKPGKLTEEEWEVIKRHSADGERIVSYVKDLSPLVHMIRHHHEWYDGSGYPDGLKGKAIPLGARIITIADAYDTMTARRPYREPVSPAEALEELVRCSGTQFDPKLVEAFIGFSREHK